MTQRRKPKSALREVPDSLAVISRPGYEYALSFHQEGKAYLAGLVSDRPQFELSEDKSLIIPAGISIRDYLESNVGPYSPMVLAALFTLVHANPSDDQTAKYQVYLPDLLGMVGKRANLSKQQTLAFVETEVKPLSSLVGILTEENKVFPVLPSFAYGEETNCISFRAPYFDALTGKFSGTDRASYSYLIRTSALGKCNADVYENLKILTVLIEQAGRHPHIRAETILERNPYLQKRIDDCLPNNRQKIIKQSFQTTFRLLREETRLQERYIGISLPSLEDFPNIRKMKATVYEFDNYGKRR